DSGLTNGWFVMNVDDRTDARDISDDVRKQLGQKAAKDWLDQQLKELNYQNKVTAADATWADTTFKIRTPGLSDLNGLPPGSTPFTPPLPAQPQPAPAAPGAAPPAQPA